MIATIVNCIAIIVGSIFGLLFSKKISDQMEDSIMTAAGIVTSVLAIQMAFKYQNVIYLTLSLIMGGMIGTALDIDGKILILGKLLERLVYGKNTKAPETNSQQINSSLERKTNNFAYAFLNASVLFCVGAMAIVGSFKAGIEKDYSIIFTKSILDGFMAISYGAAMGIGTAFSALAILVYQGGLTLLSKVVSPFVNEQMIAELTGCGGAIILMIGLNLLGIKKIKTANFLPALLFVVLFVLMDPLFKKIGLVF